MVFWETSRYQVIWTATMVYMSSRHLKTTVFTKSREDFEWPFLKVFLPFVLLGSACGLPSGRGSRGNTPLHLAAREGHDFVVKQLLQAKAAVDVKSDEGRGLGRGLGGKPYEGWDHCGRKWMKMLMVQVFCDHHHILS